MRAWMVYSSTSHPYCLGSLVVQWNTYTLKHFICRKPCSFDFVKCKSTADGSSSRWTRCASVAGPSQNGHLRPALHTVLSPSSLSLCSTGNRSVPGLRFDSLLSRFQIIQWGRWRDRRDSRATLNWAVFFFAFRILRHELDRIEAPDRALGEIAKERKSGNMRRGLRNGAAMRIKPQDEERLRTRFQIVARWTGRLTDIHYEVRPQATDITTPLVTPHWVLSKPGWAPPVGWDINRWGRRHRTYGPWAIGNSAGIQMAAQRTEFVWLITGTSYALSL